MLTNKMTGEFADSENGGFFLAPRSGEKLISAPKELYDGAIPSGNSIALRNLLYLYKVTGDSKYRILAEKSAKLSGGAVSQYPQGFTAFLDALAMMLYPSIEAVICGEKDSADTHVMIDLVKAAKKPNVVILLKTPDNAAALTRIAPFTEGMAQKEGKATAYVCSDFTCSKPANDIEELKRKLA